MAGFTNGGNSNVNTSGGASGMIGYKENDTKETYE